MGRGGRVHITSLVTLHVYGKNQRGKAEFKEGWRKLEDPKRKVMKFPRCTASIL